MVFVPILIAVSALFITIVAFPIGVGIAIAVVIGASFWHAGYLATRYVHSRKSREGEQNVPILFRSSGLCILLFMPIEALSSFAYYAAACAVILKNTGII